MARGDQLKNGSQTWTCRCKCDHAYGVADNCCRNCNCRCKRRKCCCGKR